MNTESVSDAETEDKEVVAEGDLDGTVTESTDSLSDAEVGVVADSTDNRFETGLEDEDESADSELDDESGMVGGDSKESFLQIGA